MPFSALQTEHVRSLRTGISLQMAEYTVKSTSQSTSVEWSALGWLVVIVSILTVNYYIIAVTVGFTGYWSYFAHYKHSPAFVLSLIVYLSRVPQHPPLDWCRSSWRRAPWSIWSDCTAELQAASAEILEKSWSTKDIFYYIWSHRIKLQALT